MSIRTDAVAAMVSMSHRSAAPEDRELPAADHEQKAAKGRWERDPRILPKDPGQEKAPQPLPAPVRAEVAEDLPAVPAAPAKSVRLSEWQASYA